MRNGLVWVDGGKDNCLCVDLDKWELLDLKVIRQIRNRQVNYGKYTCPNCSMELGIPLSFFTIHKNNILESDRELVCAEDSHAHGYDGGCRKSFFVMRKRES
jgi:hypothetical protein